MAHIERMQTECPPDAHKVIRPPENEVNALLCVKLDTKQCEHYGNEDFCSMLSLMSKHPMVLCDAALKEILIAGAAAAEIEPSFLQLDADGKSGNLSYMSGAVGETLPVVDLTCDDAELSRSVGFLDLLSTKQIIVVDAEAMLILRSISTVYPWDKLLAGDYLRQYLKARKEVTAEDLGHFNDVRFGRVDGFSLKGEYPVAYRYLQLERKLFLQYPDDED